MIPEEREGYLVGLAFNLLDLPLALLEIVVEAIFWLMAQPFYLLFTFCDYLSLWFADDDDWDGHDGTV